MSCSSPHHRRSGVATLVAVTLLIMLGVLWRSFDAAYADSPTASARSDEQSDPIAMLAGLQEKFGAVARAVTPSVVAISAPSSVVDPEGTTRSSEMSPDKLRSMLDRSWRAVGTGFVIDSDGYIVTNEHVITHAQQMWVTTDDRKVYPAIVVGSDPRMDLAVLKIPARNLPVVRFASYGSLQRGQWSIALGNPFGLAAQGEMSMSIGVVSALDRSLPELARKEDRLYLDLIQTTAQINPGNSGGPLLNIHGEVIGINTATIFANGANNGVGFAIPITPKLMERIASLKEGREVADGYLGVAASVPTPSQREAAGLQEAVGASVDYVDPGSPAAAGRMSLGDIILKVDGEMVRSSDQLARLIATSSVDKPTTLVICRDGRMASLEIQLRRRESPIPAVTRDTQRLRWRGMLLGSIPPHWSLGTTTGPLAGVMVVAIEKDSPLSKQGLSQGSIITALSGQAVRSLEDFQRILNDTPAERCQIEVAPPPATASAQQYGK